MAGLNTFNSGNVPILNLRRGRADSGHADPQMTEQGDNP